MTAGFKGGAHSDPLHDVVTVESESLRAELDPANGSLRRLSRLNDGWHILRPDGLGMGFSLRIPLEGRRNNVGHSTAQGQPSWSRDEATGAVQATWQSVASTHGGVHDIDVRITVAPVGERLVFTVEIDNRSELIVEDVVFPLLDGLVPPQRDAELSIFSFGYAAGRRRSIWPTFENVPGYFGVDVPTVLGEGHGAEGAPGAPFVLLEAGSEGLYIGVDEPSSELVAWIAELRPGYGDSLLHRVPDFDDRLPEQLGLRFQAAHLPYVASGERRELTPIALAAYDGDWHAGADIYIARRREWMGAAEPPSWASEPHSWLQLQMNSPEDELRLRFEDLPAVARSCAKHGVGVIQLVGWNTGGQDRDNPSHIADQRLGGPEALRDAIAACQAEGVRVVLFTKFTWADRSTERFRRELVHDAAKDPYGDYYLYPGYRYQTVAQLLDVNTRRLVPMCFESSHYKDVALKDFLGVLDTGADGMLFDECFHHTPALLCFDETHGHRRGHPVYAADRELIRMFKRHAAGRDSAFLYAGEACYDWELDVYQLSYHRSEDPAHIPLSRYLWPDAQFMTAVTGFDDRNMINQALMYRYIVSYEPYNFKGRLEDFPATTSYGRAMEALRLELREWLWDGTFRDTVGAVVTAEGATRPIPFAVFARRGDSSSSSSCAVVVANYDLDDSAIVSVDMDCGGELVYRTVDDPSWCKAANGLALAPRTAAVVLPSSEVL